MKAYVHLLAVSLLHLFLRCVPEESIASTITQTYLISLMSCSLLLLDEIVVYVPLQVSNKRRNLWVISMNWPLKMSKRSSAYPTVLKFSSSSPSNVSSITRFHRSSDKTALCGQLDITLPLIKVWPLEVVAVWHVNIWFIYPISHWSQLILWKWNFKFQY